MLSANKSISHGCKKIHLCPAEALCPVMAESAPACLCRYRRSRGAARRAFRTGRGDVPRGRQRCFSVKPAYCLTAPAASDVLSAPPPGAAAARGPAARVFPPRPVPAAIRSGQKDIPGRRECLFIRLSGDYTTVCRGALPDGAFSRFAAAGGS